MATFEDFQQIDMRVGTVQTVDPFLEGRYSTHILTIDFGKDIGVKKSLAKLAPNYEGKELIGTQILGVVNFPPRQIGPHQSEVLTLGVVDEQENVILLRVDKSVPNGGKVH